MLKSAQTKNSSARSRLATSLLIGGTFCLAAESFKPRATAAPDLNPTTTLPTTSPSFVEQEATPDRVRPTKSTSTSYTEVAPEMTKTEKAIRSSTFVFGLLSGAIGYFVYLARTIPEARRNKTYAVARTLGAGDGHYQANPRALRIFLANHLSVIVATIAIAGTALKELAPLLSPAIFAAGSITGLYLSRKFAADYKQAEERKLQTNLATPGPHVDSRTRDRILTAIEITAYAAIATVFMSKFPRVAEIAKSHNFPLVPVALVATLAARGLAVGVLLKDFVDAARNSKTLKEFPSINCYYWWLGGTGASVALLTDFLATKASGPYTYLAINLVAILTGVGCLGYLKRRLAREKQGLDGDRPESKPLIK